MHVNTKGARVMGTKFGSSSVLGAAMLSIACSDSTPNGTTGLVDASGTPQNDSGTPQNDASSGVSVQGSVVEFGTNQPLSGFQVCLKGSSTCDTTGADGQFTLPAPANQEVAFTFVRDGYVQVIVAIRTAEADIQIVPMAFTVTSTQADSIVSMLGFTWDRSKGISDVGAPPQSGVTITLSPKSGGGPYVGLGLMVLANIDPGEVELRAASPSGPCKFSDQLWRGSSPGTVRLPISAGFLTRMISLDCSMDAGAAQADATVLGTDDGAQQSFDAAVLGE